MIVIIIIIIAVILKAAQVECPQYNNTCECNIVQFIFSLSLSSFDSSSVESGASDRTNRAKIIQLLLYVIVVVVVVACYSMLCRCSFVRSLTRSLARSLACALLCASESNGARN